ncbi:hypothetical protein Scep_028136 [Stephania cephalantha]|uniref:Uncharacterized protein n=1 Tax=Stephania cephalantha TaxID=152367 RepID=A0AAP0HJ92_9MAGN
MRLLQSSTIASPPLILPKPISPPPPISWNLAFKPSRKPLPISLCSSPKHAPQFSEKEVLDSIVDSSSDGGRKSLPCVRVYENDLARVSLVGDVAFEQAVTAAAADGGTAADEHVLGGMSTMVVETVFPGAHGERSTVSTRLFLPAIKVKEKAGKLRNTLPTEMLFGTTSKNILAMTFRQVILQQVWSFELVSFGPGTERNMKDLEKPREVPAFFGLNTSDGHVLSMLAEAVCMLALESTKRDIHESSHKTAANSINHWFQKPRPKQSASRDFSVSICEVPEDEIVTNAKKLLHIFNIKGTQGLRGIKNQYQWWKASTYIQLEKIGGSEFITWANEYVPAYRLEIDTDKFKGLKLQGWTNSAENRWEVLLTHSQMVDLADVLDMYYDDTYTVPDKQLSCSSLDITSLSKSKVFTWKLLVVIWVIGNRKGLLLSRDVKFESTSFWKLLSIVLASGFFMVFVGFLAQFYWPHLKVRGSTANPGSVSVSEVDCEKHQTFEVSELENLCISLLNKIKTAVGWPGDIVADKNGAWMGELPSYLRSLDDAGAVDVVSSNALRLSSSNRSDGGMDLSGNEIASYQVHLLKDGTIVGLHPMSPLAASHWASSPLAKELYNGKKLSGVAGAAISRANEVGVIELLMSVNPDSWLAIARPVHRSQ